MKTKILIAILLVLSLGSVDVLFAKKKKSDKIDKEQEKLLKVKKSRRPVIGIKLERQVFAMITSSDENGKALPGSFYSDNYVQNIEFVGISINFSLFKNKLFLEIEKNLSSGVRKYQDYASNITTDLYNGAILVPVKIRKGGRNFIGLGAGYCDAKIETISSGEYTGSNTGVKLFYRFEYFTKFPVSDYFEIAGGFDMDIGYSTIAIEKFTNASNNVLEIEGKQFTLDSSGPYFAISFRIL